MQQFERLNRAGVQKMTDQQWVYLNGQFVHADAARISPFDRGFMFAHAAYEVTAIYAGRMIDWASHQARLTRTLGEIDIALLGGDLRALQEELLARNRVSEGLLYLQVSAGSYGMRDFAGPQVLEPGLFLFTTSKPLITAIARDGLHAISQPDTRWTRRDIKTTQLLSQVLAYRAARVAGVETAWLHEDGVVTEAASANAWIVTRDGVLVTRDLSNALLPGITRQSVMGLMREDGYRVEERSFSLDEVYSAAEAFTTSTGVVIAPVLSLDGKTIGAGVPGPVTRAVQRHYYAYLGADVAVRAPWAMVLDRPDRHPGE